MFQTVDETWNPFTGCDFGCRYCWARKLAEGKLKYTERYKDGFHPAFHPRELSKRFKAGQFVGVSLMGDISFACREVIIRIVEAIQDQPEVNFLFCTKKPQVYLDWHVVYPDNLFLGATIETNYDFRLTKAPVPENRYMVMRELGHIHKFISIEPLVDFHLATMVRWMREIQPEIIEIGSDNYHNDLPEPRAAASDATGPWKVKWLLDELREFCPNVIEKKGLERLKGEGTYGREK